MLQTSIVEDVLSDEEIERIAYRDSLDGLQEQLEKDFDGRSVVVNLQGVASGLWFLQDFWCDISTRKDGTRFLTLNADDGTETSISIEESDFDIWDKDDITEAITISMDDDTVISVYIM